MVSGGMVDYFNKRRVLELRQQLMERKAAEQGGPAAIVSGGVGGEEGGSGEMDEESEGRGNPPLQLKIPSAMAPLVPQFNPEHYDPVAYQQYFDSVLLRQLPPSFFTPAVITVLQSIWKQIHTNHRYLLQSLGPEGGQILYWRDLAEMVTDVPEMGLGSWPPTKVKIVSDLGFGMAQILEKLGATYPPVLGGPSGTQPVPVEPSRRAANIDPAFQRS
ncbi:cytochrome c oxidase, subunit VIb [Pseudohyphozyma bogoriensis]|nr:cytochrome c oxidase, subunit VIb [Pseudohyphozyma bogoriensis]